MLRGLAEPTSLGEGRMSEVIEHGRVCQRGMAVLGLLAGPAPSPRRSTAASSTRSPKRTGSWSPPPSRPGCAGENSSRCDPATSTASAACSPWKIPIVEVPLRAAPAGQRMIVKPYPKDNEPRTLALRPQLLHALHDHIQAHSLTDGDLLFATRDGNPISRNTFRTRIWAPAVKPDSGPPDTAVHPHVARLRSSPRRSRLFAALPRLWSLPKAATP